MTPIRGIVLGSDADRLIIEATRPLDIVTGQQVVVSTPAEAFEFLASAAQYAQHSMHQFAISLDSQRQAILRTADGCTKTVLLDDRHHNEFKVAIQGQPPRSVSYQSTGVSQKSQIMDIYHVRTYRFNGRYEYLPSGEPVRVFEEHLSQRA